MTSSPDPLDHPDYRLISQVLLDMDAQQDAGIPFEDTMGRMFSTEPVSRAAMARAGRAAAARGSFGLPPGTSRDVQDTVLSAGAWMDGFLAGVMAQQAKYARTYGSLLVTASGGTEDGYRTVRVTVLAGGALRVWRDHSFAPGVREFDHVYAPGTWSGYDSADVAP
jgi:hypothetical protein